MLSRREDRVRDLLPSELRGMKGPNMQSEMALLNASSCLGRHHHFFNRLELSQRAVAELDKNRQYILKDFSGIFASNIPPYIKTSDI